MKKALLLFTFFLSVFQVKGQTNSEINQILLNESLKDFENYFDSISEVIDMKEKYLDRDLTKEYKEKVFYATYYPQKGNYLLLFGIRVSLIVKGDQIIYYKLTENRAKKTDINLAWNYYSYKVYSFRNDSLMSNLIDSVKQNYNTDLNEEELFSVYYYSEGYCDRNDDRKLIDAYVQNNDKKSLMIWLQSIITEKQIYAVDGFYKLKQKGIALTSEELKMINYVIGKKGKIGTCGYDMMDAQEIEEVVKKFKF